MDEVTTEELHRIADGLGERISGQGTLFSDSAKVRDYIDNLYTRLVNEKRIDRVLESRKKQEQSDWQRIDMNSIQNKDVRELGGEWLCLQILSLLMIENYLISCGWSDIDCKIALAHIVSRTVYLYCVPKGHKYEVRGILLRS